MHDLRKLGTLFVACSAWQVSEHYELHRSSKMPNGWWFGDCINPVLILRHITFFSVRIYGIPYL